MKIKFLVGLVLFALIFNLSFQGITFAEFEGAAAQDFTLGKVEGGTSSFSDYKGKSNIILIFWTIKGLYCAYELEGLRDRYTELKKNDFEVIAVNIKEESAKVKDFVLQEKIQFPVLLDSDGKVSKMYEIKGMPVILIIDKQGEIKWRGYKFPARYLELVQ